MRPALAIALLAVLAGALPGAAQQSAMDSVVSACMASDTSTRWKKVAAEWAERASERGTNDSLRARLVALGEADQAIREVPGLVDSLRSESFGRRMRERDSANAAALMEIAARHGWPTRSMVGVDGASAAFLVAQHNPSIQREALRLMLALPPGEVSPADLALLHDRVLVGEGKPQRYGSQLGASAGGAMKFDPIEDIGRVDARRAEVGLFPLGTYVCIMRGVMGQAVADPRGSP